MTLVESCIREDLVQSKIGKYIIGDFYRCKCNGHANNCSMVPINETVIMTAEDGTQEIKINAGGERMECACQHGTDGPNCEMCLPDHNSRPWRRATQEDAHECRRKSNIYF